jgi:hypothetical protein
MDGTKSEATSFVPDEYNSLPLRHIDGREWSNVSEVRDAADKMNAEFRARGLDVEAIEYDGELYLVGDVIAPAA